MFLVSNFLIALSSQLVLNPDVDEGSVIAYQLEPHAGAVLSWRRNVQDFPSKENMLLWMKWGNSFHWPHFGVHWSIIFTPRPLSRPAACSQWVNWRKGILEPAIPAQCSGPPHSFPEFTADGGSSQLIFLLSFTSSCSSPLYPHGSPLPYISCTSISCLGIFFPKDPSWHHQYYNALQFTADEGRLQSEKRESINTFPFKKFMHTPEMRGSLKKIPNLHFKRKMWVSYRWY